jgi:hypothetical protein
MTNPCYQGNLDEQYLHGLPGAALLPIGQVKMLEFIHITLLLILISK